MYKIVFNITSSECTRIDIWVCTCTYAKGMSLIQIKWQILHPSCTSSKQPPSPLQPLVAVGDHQLMIIILHCFYLRRPFVVLRVLRLSPGPTILDNSLMSSQHRVSPELPLLPGKLLLRNHLCLLVNWPMDGWRVKKPRPHWRGKPHRQG